MIRPLFACLKCRKISTIHPSIYSVEAGLHAVRD